MAGGMRILRGDAGHRRQAEARTVQARSIQRVRGIREIREIREIRGAGPGFGDRGDEGQVRRDQAPGWVPGIQRQARSRFAGKGSGQDGRQRPTVIGPSPLPFPCRSLWPDRICQGDLETFDRCLALRGHQALTAGKQQDQGPA